MSFKTLETSVRNAARLFLNNPKLKLDDIVEWSTGSVDVRADEVRFEISGGIQVVVESKHDKRPKAT